MPTLEAQPYKPRGRARLIAVVGASTAALLLPFTSSFEGTKQDPYRDLVGKWTVCTGETRVKMRHYSLAECDDMLANGLADFAGPVLKRNPELRGYPHQLAAAADLAYNIGPSNYNRSQTAALFSGRQWRRACDAMMGWSKAGGRVVQGLVNRRAAERRMCLTGLT